MDLHIGWDASLLVVHKLLQFPFSLSQEVQVPPGFSGLHGGNFLLQVHKFLAVKLTVVENKIDEWLGLSIGFGVDFYQSLQGLIT